MKISEVIRITDEICPPELAEEWDKCGWQIKCGDGDVTGVLTALEITGAVIDEAVSRGANLIITHHPMIFQGIKSVDVNTVLGNYIIRLINNGISVYSCHTDFDKAEGGNNDYIGEALELTGQVYDQWQERHFYLHATMRHSDTDQILRGFRTVLEYLRLQEADQYNAANADLVTQLELLAEMEQPTLVNVL